MKNDLPRLIVPINVEAFCVNRKIQASNFLPAVTNFQTLPYNKGAAAQKPFLSERVLAQPFSPGTVETGVHLHWAMPDALMHGEQTTSKTAANRGLEPQAAMRFPRLPDRWLITRTELGAKTDGACPTASWIVDSRYVSETISSANAGSSAIPWENSNDPEFTRPPFRYLGRTLPLEQWSAPGQESLLTELTAASLGFIQASAYYPNCRNVFGMHHPAPDKPTEYAYTVCGWHADPSDDPLHGKTAEEAAQALAALRWNASREGAFDGVLYVGVVHSVCWDPDLESAAPASLTAVFGNTTAEANAALHEAMAPRRSFALGSQLHALLTGQLDLLHEAGGELRVQRQLHQQRFSPAATGTVWYVADPADGSDAFGSLNETQKQLLNQLNQAEDDRLVRQVDASERQWQLFADWYKYLKCKYPDPREQLPDADDVRDFITDNSLAAAEKSIAACRSAVEKVARCHSALIQAINAKNGPALELKGKPQANSWRPVDPVLLLQGQDVKPALRFGSDGELSCQIFGGAVEDGMLSGLELRDGQIEGVRAARLDATADTPDLGAGATKLGPLQAPIQAAVLQGLLLWPAWAGLKLAIRAASLDSAAAIANWLRAQDVQQGGSPWIGKPPERRSITAWEGNPWLPIMMHWDISYQPLAIIQEDKPQAEFDRALVMNRVADSLDSEEVDLVLEPASPRELRDTLPRHHRGINFITPQAGQAVKKQLKARARLYPNSMLAALEPSTENIPLLSQALSGFHDRLLLRRQSLQVDVRDPFATGKHEKEFAEAVRKAVTDLDSRVATMAPVVEEAFNPVRGGDFSLERLWLGDVFGQCRQYVFGKRSHLAATLENRVLAAPSLARDDGAGMQPSFPPRISQPARLDFNWLSAAGDGAAEQDSAGSPICGWIVPNYLDRSLAFYDDTGKPLGSIIAIGDDLAWQGSPARPQTFGIPPEKLFEDKNTHLRDYALTLLRHPGKAKFVNAYLDTLNLAMTTIQPVQAAQHATLPVLAGQPLALVRSAVKLNLIGPPAVNQTWTAFQYDMTRADSAARNSQTSIERTTNAHERVKYPVVLGMASDPDDGLVGFYIGGEGERRFEEFYAIAAMEKQFPGITPSRVHTLQLQPRDTEPRQLLTMLVDPRAQVSITCGYAPAQTRFLPAEAVRSALAKIAVTFLTAPVLSTEPPPDDGNGKVRLPLPLPGQQKGSWNWVRVVNNAAGKQRAIVAGAGDVNAVQGLPSRPLSLQDGWLSLTGLEERD